MGVDNGRGFARFGLRGAARRAVVLAALAIAGLLVFAVPAWAHHPVLSGNTSCANGDHVVHWTIGNSESNHVMTITSAVANVGANTYAVTGYSPTVGNGGSTSATTIVPGNVTGTVTLTVAATWNDGATATRQTTVELIGQCGGTTTTTQSSTSTSTSSTTATTSSSTSTSSSTTTSTIGGETSTASSSTTTSTIAPLGSTTSIAPLDASTTPIAPLGETAAASGTTAALPRTGSGVSGEVVFGASLLLAGAVLAMRRRTRTTR